MLEECVPVASEIGRVRSVNGSVMTHYARWAVGWQIAYDVTPNAKSRKLVA